jgi:hypothetical protein
MYHALVDASVKCTMHLWMRLVNVNCSCVCVCEMFNVFVDASVKYSMYLLWMRLLMYNTFVDASVKCSVHLWMRLLNVQHVIGVDTGALWRRRFHLSQATLTDSPIF